MTEKLWYEDIARDELAGKHVRAVFGDDIVVESCLVYSKEDECVRLGSNRLGQEYFGRVVLVYGDDGHLHQLSDWTSLDLVWDERDWDRIDVKDLRVGDAVVVSGVLYEVTKASLVHTDYPCVGTDALGRNPIDLRLVSCALRRKVKVPLAAGYYVDRGGYHWVRSKGHDGQTWRMVEPDSTMTPTMSSDEMLGRMPLTPVHFESGRAA